MRLRSPIYAVWSLCLASCAVGPRFKAPAADVPPAFGAAPKQEMAPARVSSEDPGPNWWHAFHDDELDRLEDRARRGNLDLQAGLLRIVAARTQVQVARAQGLPSLNATASYNREQLGFAGILKAQGGTTGTLDPALVSALTSPVSLYQVGFDASWELDLFGKVSRSVEAAKAQSDAAVESRNDMLVSLQAEVAQTYMQLRAAQSLRSITQGLIADQQEILELTMSKHDHGLADDADVESARAQVSSLKAQLPQYDQNMAASRHAISLLLGETPTALDLELGPAAPLPAVPQLIPVGLPSTLARRRPDIREAEASLHAATAQIGVSMASLYPDVALAGTLGLRNISTHYLFDWASKFYTAGPTVSLPIFHGGALVANVKMAHAEEAAAALAYRKTVLTALQEVEDGLVSLDQDAVRVTALHDAVAADQRSFEIATHSYKVGLTSYVSVLTQALQMNQAKEQLAQASLTQVTDLVKLYKALGGGWQSDPTSAAN